MKLAIIGAGVSGLGVLREALTEHLDCTVFEQSGKIGGLWNYSVNTDQDEDGLPIHSAIYEGMTTNVPKEVMSFEDFPHDGPSHSFVSHEDILKYIHRFADNFDLKPHIKFYSEVTCVEPVEGGRWWIKTKHVKTSGESEYVFDAVVVCNGHFYKPFIPEIPGADLVKNFSTHSRDYRTTHAYRDKVVLIVGGGRSGTDIGRILVPVARKVLISYRGKTFCPLDPSCVPKSSAVKYFTRKTAVFEDGSEELIDKVIYCTGYNFTFKFLSPKCGITCEKNWVRPLYKQVININYPTMAVISVNDFSLIFPLCGLQARFFFAFLKRKIFKNMEEMTEDLDKEIKEKQEKGIPARCMHSLGVEGYKKYSRDLAATAGLKPLAVVFEKIFENSVCMGCKDIKFRVISDEDFEQF